MCVCESVKQAQFLLFLAEMRFLKLLAFLLIKIFCNVFKNNENELSKKMNFNFKKNKKIKCKITKLNTNVHKQVDNCNADVFALSVLYFVKNLLRFLFVFR